MLGDPMPKEPFARLPTFGPEVTLEAVQGGYILTINGTRSVHTDIAEVVGTLRVWADKRKLKKE